MPPGGSVKPKPSILVVVLRILALYAFSYALYWGAAWMIGSPHEFANLWAKALTPVAVVAAAFYFNQTNQRRGQ
jgi:uncharacterized membrane-anchored protein